MSIDRVNAKLLIEALPLRLKKFWHIEDFGSTTVSWVRQSRRVDVMMFDNGDVYLDYYERNDLDNAVTQIEFDIKGIIGAVKELLYGD